MNILDYADNIPNEVRELLNFDPNWEEQFLDVVDKLEEIGYEVDWGNRAINSLMPANKLFYLMDNSRLDTYDGVTHIKVGEYFWWEEDIDDDTSVYRRASTNEVGGMNNDRFIACPRAVLECKLKSI